MLPTLAPGDRLLVDLGAYGDRPPEVGDIVVLVDPQATDRWLVKRVAGVGPGRFWVTRTGFVPAASETPDSDPAPPSEVVESISLSDSMLIVTGDAPAARDSRRFGPIRFDALIGQVYRRYAPTDRRRDF
jgi:signal peptidase I